MKLYGVTKWGLLWMWLLTALQLHAGSVVLHLKNGDRLTGSVLSEKDGQLTLKTLWQKEVVIPLSAIERREAVPGESAKPPPAAATATAPPAPPAPPPTAASKPKPKAQWAGQINLGMDVVRSETDRELYQGSFSVTYTRGRFRNIADYRAAYGKTAGTLSANRMDGSLKTDVDIGARRRIFLYNLAAAGYDEIRKINLQYEAGPGMGYHVVTRTNFVLNAEMGGNFLAIDYADRSERQEMNLRFAEDAHWALTSRISLKEKMEFLPKPDDFSVYRLRLESTLSYLLMKNLSLNLSVVDIYDTRPARTVTKNDLQILSTIGIKF